jgi:hypothetical protein
MGTGGDGNGLSGAWPAVTLPVPTVAATAFGLVRTGRPAAALQLIKDETGISRAADLPDLSGAAGQLAGSWVMLLHAAGWATGDLGDDLAARELLVAGYDLAMRADLATSAGTLAYEIAVLDLRCGRIGEAQLGCTIAIGLRLQREEDPLRPMLLLAGALAAASRLGEALAAVSWAVDCAAATGDPAAWSDALERHGHIALAGGDYRTAVRQLVMALRLARMAGLREPAARVAGLLADLAANPVLAADPVLAGREQ